MGLGSVGFKIGLASGFMNRREKIAEEQKEETEDFRDATKAAKLKANAILRVEKERDADEYKLGKGVLQQPELAPLLKDIELSDHMIQMVGRDWGILKASGASIKSTAIALRSKIVDKTIQLDKIAQKTNVELERQKNQAESEKEDSSGNFISTLARSFSGSAKGEASRDLIRKGITPDQQEVMDRGNTYRERKTSLGLSPKKMLTSAEKNRMEKSVVAAIAAGDGNAKFNDMGELRPDSVKNSTNQRIQIATALITANKNQYGAGDGGDIIQALQDLEESGYQLDNTSTAIILTDIRRRGATNVMDELLNNEHPTQKKEQAKNTGADSIEETQEEDSNKLKQSIEEQAKNIRDKGTRIGRAKKGKEIGELSQVWKVDGRNYKITSKNSKAIKTEEVEG